MPEPNTSWDESKWSEREIIAGRPEKIDILELRSGVKLRDHLKVSRRMTAPPNVFDIEGTGVIQLGNVRLRVKDGAIKDVDIIETDGSTLNIW